ncbi:response regulator [Actinoallomurus iriomotensis]|uniref:Response regulator n=1 Tax=Actinoallomurus iriomotensis TaxID=478107 RepID=A0A9W6S816_9ACTN|nr:response regulator [Actinoallomurus iriomotensis]
MTISCVIVDDNDRFLNAAGALLERDGITVVAVATNSAEALRRAGELRPDVLLVDVELGHESGLDLTRRLMAAASVPQARVILMSAHSEDDFGGLIGASPALGFLAKARLSGGAIRRLLGDGHRVPG